MSDEIEQLVDNLSSASRGDGIEFVAAGDTVDSAAEVAAARAGLLSAVAALRSERDDARERHETASRELRILGVVNDSLRAENERLRADAERLREKIAHAYGHLWHVNNEPLAPVPLRSNETAAYAARRILRDTLTSEQRGAAINAVREELESAARAALEHKHG